MPATEDPASVENRLKAVVRASRTSLFDHGRVTPAQRLAALASVDLGPSGEASDLYGAGGVVAELEAEVAELLGKPAAAFMPSGIMAQQCVLRVWSDRQASKRVAVHALSHLVMHELSALETLHGLQVEHLATEPRQPTVADLAGLPGRLGAVSIELPLRDAGYLLPSWSELEDFAAACRERGVPLHIDGARLWESAPYWDREPAEIAALADSIYVSFYKGLAGLAGAAVAGPVDVIDEARRWQRRHGGTLVTLLPYAVSAREGLRRHAPQMKRYHEAAVEVAAVLSAAGLRIEPDPPHTNSFRIYAPCPADAINERLLVHLESAHEAATRGFRRTDVPGWSMTEFTAGAATLEAGAKAAGHRIAEVILALTP